ncbi:MAG TPA: acyl-CoA carboxylase epsilon subunit [Gryllotalpicola sp.]
MSARHLDTDAAAAGIRFVTQGLAPEEVAAATAVLATALHEQARSADARVQEPKPSEWNRSTRGLRGPLRGGWRGFTAEGL